MTPDSAKTAAPPDLERVGSPGGEQPHDAEARLTHGRELAWRSLNRRDRTVAELRRHLLDKDVEAATTDAVIEELLEGGYLDDARFARRFAEDRRRLDSWGGERIGRRLHELGVASDLISAALAEQDTATELEVAGELLERRFPGPLDSDRDRTRALGLLLRRGYASETAYEALRRHRAG